MKVLQTEITPTLNSYFAVVKRDDSHFKAPFHAHPELELVYIQEGSGKRIIGNNIENFEAGDMVFIGSNLPHVWLSHEDYYKDIPTLRARALVVYFNKEIFGQAFYSLKEATKVMDFFEKASRGIQIHGASQKKVASKMQSLMKKDGFEKIVGLLDLLHILSSAKDISTINKEAYAPTSQKADQDRLSDVYRYVQLHFKEEINLEKVAGIAHLTPQSFCRLFKKRNNKHFVEWLNEIRISKACQYLIETDWAISEIAYACGYKTVSNFNKLFKEETGASPKAYREKANN